MPDTSIVVCTYNPNRNSFLQLLRRLEQFVQNNCEVIIVDNNSTADVEGLIKSAAGALSEQITFIKESKQGLSYARQTGIFQAKGDIIVFFDDDNLPDEDYTKNTLTIFKENQHIGIIGPGNVNVQIFDKEGNAVPMSHPQLLALFQQKNITAFEYSNSPRHADLFPEGTGMAMRKEIALAYAQNVDNYKTTGRKGNSLSSGEDFQIIFQAFNKGYAVGRSPLLKIKHLIPIEKTQIEYIRKLKFGQTYSSPLAKQECFPEERAKNVQLAKSLTNFSFLMGMIRLGMMPAKDRIDFNIELARKVGWYYGYHLAADKPVPMLVKFFIRYLKLM